MNDELNKRAKEIIEKIIYITIATSNKEGQPWNSPVYSCHDKDSNFYWASWTENQHSKNIAENNNVFVVIYDSTAAEGTGEGVYMQGKAYQLSDPKEIESVLDIFYGRKNKTPRKSSEFLGDYPRRIYKFVPEKFWINVEGDVNGNYVDKRVEIKLK